MKPLLERKYYSIHWDDEGLTNFQALFVKYLAVRLYGGCTWRKISNLFNARYYYKIKNWESGCKHCNQMDGIKLIDLAKKKLNDTSSFEGTNW